MQNNKILIFAVYNEEKLGILPCAQLWNLDICHFPVLAWCKMWKFWYESFYILLNGPLKPLSMKKNLSNHEVNKYSRVESDANGLERALAFVTIYW